MGIDGNNLPSGRKWVFEAITLCSQASLFRIISRCALAIYDAMILLDRGCLLGFGVRVMTAQGRGAASWKSILDMRNAYSMASGSSLVMGYSTRWMRLCFPSHSLSPYRLLASLLKLCLFWATWSQLRLNSCRLSLRLGGGGVFLSPYRHSKRYVVR